MRPLQEDSDDSERLIRRVDSPECAIVYLDFEPAALNEFLTQLVHPFSNRLYQRSITDHGHHTIVVPGKSDQAA